MSVLANAQRIADVTSSGPARFVERHALGVKLLSTFVDMEVELALNVVIDPAGTEDVGEPIPEHFSLLAQGAHRLNECRTRSWNYRGKGGNRHHERDDGG
jgi:hypothetical protein